MSLLSKSKLKSMMLAGSGLRAFKWWTRPNGLYCFNYHRIGDATQTPYDPNVFNSTEEKFEQQVKFFKDNFTLINLDELSELIDLKKVNKDRYALITFDDGYADNYHKAFPILKSNNASATFFLPTGFITNSLIPWWDEIAWMTKQSHAKCLRFGTEAEFAFAGLSDVQKVRKVLNMVKSDPRPMCSKIKELEEKLDISFEPANHKQLLINWDMAREMVNGGMTFGSHTSSHRILSHLSTDEQWQEIVESKTVMENELKCSIDSFAYPVGSADSFTLETTELVKKAGYKMGFSFIKGHNPNVTSDNQFAIKRFGIDGCPTTGNLIQRMLF